MYVYVLFGLFDWSVGSFQIVQNNMKCDVLKIYPEVAESYNLSVVDLTMLRND